MCRLNHSILGGVVSSLQNVRAAAGLTAGPSESDGENREWDSLFRMLSNIRARAARNSESLGCAVHCSHILQGADHSAKDTVVESAHDIDPPVKKGASDPKRPFVPRPRGGTIVTIP